MTATVRLDFFKLNVPDLDAALAFWRAAFGFAVTLSFEEADFVEHIIALPGHESGPSLALVEWRDGRTINAGSAHGPVGLVCSDIVASEQAALAAGATRLAGIVEVGAPEPSVKVAVLRSPQGHEIELIEHLARPAMEN